MTFFDSWHFTFVVLPALIFLSRVCDVTIGTLRIISVSRGHKFLAPLFGFFEVLIWIVVMGKVMQNMGNVFCYIGYAGGFAAGNFVGIIIEERLAMGMLIIRIIAREDAADLITNLRDDGYGATSIPAEGKGGPVFVVYSIIKRSDLKDVVETIKKFNPKAFYSVEDVRFVSEGVFPSRANLFQRSMINLPKIFRKGK